MKTLLLAAALIATPAFAELPIGSYGSPEACANYAASGYPGEEDDDYLFVTSTSLEGFEWSCEFNGDTIGTVPLSCSESATPYSGQATITIDGDWLSIGLRFWENDTPADIVDAGVTKLRRCSTSETPLM